MTRGQALAIALIVLVAAGLATLLLRLPPGAPVEKEHGHVHEEHAHEADAAGGHEDAGHDEGEHEGGEHGHHESADETHDEADAHDADRVADAVELSDDALRVAKVQIEAAGPATIRTTLHLTGQIGPNEDRLAHVMPRFPGIAREAPKRLGETVTKGEIIAVVQSNESLQAYPVPAPISGTVVGKDVMPGEVVATGEAMYVVADLSTVWVSLNVYRGDLDRVKHGQEVLVDGGSGTPPARGAISFISPYGAAETQSVQVRVELANSDGSWRPGLFVRGELILDEALVPVAVRASALQRLGERDVVFVRHGDELEARRVQLGRRDADHVEIVSGIEPGQRYAAHNSFIAKAELGKSTAGHDH